MKCCKMQIWLQIMLVALIEDKDMNLARSMSKTLRTILNSYILRNKFRFKFTLYFQNVQLHPKFVLILPMRI